MNALILSPALAVVAAGVLGLAVGSFLNVVIYRLPRVMRREWAADAAELFEDEDVRQEVEMTPAEAEHLAASSQLLRARVAALAPLSISRPRSRCSSCGHVIRPIENIPVFSWLFLRARCAACGCAISARYPIVEAVTALLFAGAAWRFGVTLWAAAAMVLIAYLVAMTLIDADTMLLPDTLTLPLMWLGLLFSIFGGFVSLQDSLVGAMAGYLVFWSIGTLFRVLRGMEGMGAGDYKLLAALGAWFGWKALLPIVLISAGVGSVVGITLMAIGRANALTRLPFGVYLAPAGVVMLFFGETLIGLLLPGAR